ncbi:efflux RND transporter periplasmic adaptor subunit [Ectobacillus ponti]|uniref:Efflux RND transporter periplasmic adaptor subunit n=1 Tax=Ectobacillus ponti TaxID=2961894 RepID=A0AA42BNJ5_9BACI|nr:efflux RND transporter periplasmic adaptor subunit [Ectobacillus ponti]MCP8967722.1 efflux RND transporter periplasmic adaptor subunit [Ectobacillus ponti]
MQTETVRSPKKKKWIIAGIAAAVLLIAGVNVAVLQSKKKAETGGMAFTSLSEKTLNNTKLVSGRVSSGEITSLYPDAAKGKLKELLVKKGDEVQAGQKLYTYESADLTLQLKQLEMDEKITSLRYSQTKDKVKSLKADIQKAKDASAPAEVLNPLQAQLGELEVTQKTTELEMERNKLQREQLVQKQAELTVTSPVAGIVQQVDEQAVQAGAGMAAGAKAILQIAPKAPFVVEGSLNELQKAQVQPGQEVSLTSKAVPNKTWKGKITEVSSYPNTAEAGQLTAAAGQDAGTISYYAYKASLDTQDGLAPGYHVSLQVNITSKTIQAIPRSSLVEKGDSPFVYVAENGKLKEQKVTTGLSDGEWIEIIEGLKPEQKVVKSPTDKLYAGMEVKP